MVIVTLLELIDRHSSQACRNDAKTVSIVVLGCFHPFTKVQSASLHFFLGSDDEQEEDSDDDEVCNVVHRL